MLVQKTNFVGIFRLGASLNKQTDKYNQKLGTTRDLMGEISATIQTQNSTFIQLFSDITCECGVDPMVGQKDSLCLHIPFGGFPNTQTNKNKQKMEVTSPHNFQQTRPKRLIVKAHSEQKTEGITLKDCPKNYS